MVAEVNRGAQPGTSMKSSLSSLWNDMCSWVRLARALSCFLRVRLVLLRVWIVRLVMRCVARHLKSLSTERALRTAVLCKKPKIISKMSSGRASSSHLQRLHIQWVMGCLIMENPTL